MNALPSHFGPDADGYDIADSRLEILKRELLADHGRMRALFEEDAEAQDVSELVEELIELRFLLSRMDTDERSARELAIYRRDFATRASELADGELKYQAAIA